MLKIVQKLAPAPTTDLDSPVAPLSYIHSTLPLNQILENSEN